MKSSRVSGVVLFFALLSAPAWLQAADRQATPVTAPATAAAAGAPVMEVTFHDGMLAVKAERADLLALLKRVREASHVPMELAEGISGPVTVSFAGLGLEESIARILEAAGAKNLAAEFGRGLPADGFRLRKIFVLSKGTSAAPTGIATVSSPAGWTEDSVREWLRKKYGSEWIVDQRGPRKRADFIKGKIPYYREKVDVETGRRIADRMIEETKELLDIGMSTLAFEKLYQVGGSLEFEFAQLYKDIPVDRGRLMIELWPADDSGSRNISLTNQTHPGIEVSTEPKITAEQAERKATSLNEIAVRELGYREARLHTISRPPQLLIYPKETRNPTTNRVTSYSYYLVWRVTFPAFSFEIDALSGELVGKTKRMKNSYFLSAERLGTLGGDGRYQDNGTLNPAPLQHVEFETNAATVRAASVDGTFDLAETEFPIKVRLRRPNYLTVFGRAAGQSYAPELKDWLLNRDQFTDPERDGSFAYVFKDAETASHEQNAYHQIMRGMLEYYDGPDGVAGNEPQDIRVQTGFVFTDPKVLGGAEGQTISISKAGATSSDVLLHELSHLAVERYHNGAIGEFDSQEAVSEGLADYFACVINRDPIFTAGDTKYDLDNSDGKERTPTDLDNDGVFEREEWDHYDNGDVIASILWDLSWPCQGPALLCGVSGQTLWKAVQGLEGYSPQDFYLALWQRGVPAKDLWRAFSAHGENLSVVPATEGLHLQWLKYYGEPVEYQIYRYESADPAFDPLQTSAAPIASVPAAQKEFTDPVGVGGLYYYRVVPAMATGAYFLDSAGKPIVSNEMSGILPGVAAPTDLVISKAIAQEGVIKLTLQFGEVDFSQVPATATDRGYQVYARVGDGVWAKVAVALAGSDTVEVDYQGPAEVQYQIKARYMYQQREVSGPPSNTVKYPSALSAALASPGTLRLLSFARQPGKDFWQFELGWDAVDFSGVPTGAAKGFRIYRQDFGATGWTRLTEIVSAGGAEPPTAAILTREIWVVSDYRVVAFYKFGSGDQEVSYEGPPTAAQRIPAELDLAVLYQSYFPYYNYATDSFIRYRATVQDLLTALEGSGVEAGRIWFVDAANDPAVGVEKKSFDQALEHAGQLAATGKATLLDTAVEKATALLSDSRVGSLPIRKALLFTNWLHYDPRLCSAERRRGAVPVPAAQAERGPG